jgi:hypothetical protein
VRELAAAYDPPGFEDAPGPDAALFLTAVDHRSGFRDAHRVAGEGPFSGSELLWKLGVAAERRDPGLLTAARLRDADASAVAAIFSAGGETARDPEGRAALWRDLAAGLARDHGGSAGALLEACGGRLGGREGLIARLGAFEAFGDPLRSPTPARGRSAPTTC